MKIFFDLRENGDVYSQYESQSKLQKEKEEEISKVRNRIIFLQSKLNLQQTNFGSNPKYNTTDEVFVAQQNFDKAKAGTAEYKKAAAALEKAKITQQNIQNEIKTQQERLNKIQDEVGKIRGDLNILKREVSNPVTFYDSYKNQIISSLTSSNFDKQKFGHSLKNSLAILKRGGSQFLNNGAALVIPQVVITEKYNTGGEMLDILKNIAPKLDATNTSSEQIEAQKQIFQNFEKAFGENMKKVKENYKKSLDKQKSLKKILKNQEDIDKNMKDNGFKLPNEIINSLNNWKIWNQIDQTSQAIEDSKSNALKGLNLKKYQALRQKTTAEWEKYLAS